jgi:hypothetical protein
VTQQAAQPDKQAETIEPVVKTVGDLFSACKKQWNMLPEFVIKDLGLKSRLEITDPNAAYLKIKEMHKV